MPPRSALGAAFALFLLYRSRCLNGDTMSVVVYYAGSSKLTLGGGSSFKGIIYAKNAEVDITGSFGPDLRLFTGGTKVNLAGGANLGDKGLIYAPNARIYVGGGAQTGVVVGNSVEVAGGARITQNVQQIDQFPVKFSEEIQEEVIEKLEWQLCWSDCWPGEKGE